MTLYRCDFSPVSYYFFGGEKIFDYGKTNTYYISSQKEPSQSTILGALRFLVLKNHDCLSLETGEVDLELKQRQNSLIGESAFSVDSSNEFGLIKKISPMFLTIGDNHYIKTPLNHKDGNERYQPLKMSGSYLSEKGETILPSDFVAKDGISDSYMNLNTKDIKSSYDIFSYLEQTHIARKRDDDGSLILKDNAFFKKKYCYLNKEDQEISFTYYVECDDEQGEPLPKNDIVYLGQEKSAFYFKSEKVSNETINELEKQISELYKLPEYHVYYCISDCYLEEMKNINKLVAFSIVNKKGYRFISDLRNDTNMKNRIKKSEVQYQFVLSGSVFFVADKDNEAFINLIDKNNNLKNVGFNHIIEFKGGE